jgi:hypothetical protein
MPSDNSRAHSCAKASSSGPAFLAATRRNDALRAARADDEAGVSDARVTLSGMSLYVDGSGEGWPGDTVAQFTRRSV